MAEVSIKQQQIINGLMDEIERLVLENITLKAAVKQLTENCCGSETHKHNDAT